MALAGGSFFQLMEKRFWLWFISLLSFTAQAQEKSFLTLLDAHTAQVVEGAHVTLIWEGDSLNTVSDAQGRVELKAQNLLWIKVRHLSYEPYKQAHPKAGSLHFLSPERGQLEEVVVTGQNGPTLSRKAVRQVRIIDAQRIQSQAAVNLKDLLSQDLNFRISEDAVLGSQISLQGMSGAKVKILIDGVPVIGRTDGNIDLSQINLNAIERVEIVEGPMAVTYGTDAVAGTINLITKQSQRRKWQTTANAYIESVGRYNIDASLQWALSAQNQLSLSLGRNYFQGYDPDGQARDLQWNPKEQYFGSLQFKHRQGNSLWRYRLDAFQETVKNKGAIGSFDSLLVPVDTGAWKYPRALDDEYLTTRLNHSLYYHYYPEQGGRWKGFLAYNYFRREKFSRIRNLHLGTEQLFPGADAQDTSIFRMISSRLMYHRKWATKVDYQLGYDFSWEFNSGQRIEGEVQDILDAALFATAEYKPWDVLSLKPGLRYAYNSRFAAPLIASMALRWEMHPSWILRASYGKGFRAPSLKELYFLFVDENHNILGNADLKAETSHNYQLGLSYHYDKADWHWQTEARFFFNDLRDEIRLVAILSPTDTEPRGLYRNENVARSQSAGINWNWRLAKGGWNTELGMAWIGLKNEYAFSDPAANQFNFYPQYRWSISYQFAKWKLKPALFMNYTGERKDLALDSEGNLNPRQYSDYTLADFSLQKTFWQERITLSAGIKNLFDVSNIAVSGTGGGGTHSTAAGSLPINYGRTYFLRCQWKLD